MNIIVIPADEEQPIEAREIDGSLKSMQAIVGGLIQPVDIDAIDAILWCNEEGLLVGLPVNARATRYLYDKAPEHYGFTMLTGDVFVAGSIDDQGDSTDVPAGVARELSHG